MKKVCPYCGHIVDMHHVCPKKPKRYKHTSTTDEQRIRNTHKWKKMSWMIRERDGGMDQAAINGLNGQPYIMTRGLEVHHIVALKDDPSKAYDPYNLITLSSETHKMAECGDIPKDKLLEIAYRNQQLYEKK